MADYLATCEEAARCGGQVLLDWVGKFAVHEKGPADLVTEADIASQEAIRRVVLDRFPSHEFVGEETRGPLPTGGEYCWIVDPLDGTTNYVHGVPHFAVSVALVRGGNEILVGSIYDPSSRDCYTAAKGQGAFLNGRRLQTSKAQKLSEALVAASLGARVEPGSMELAQFIQVVFHCQAIRRTGSAALNLAYVAAGRFDIFWSRSTKAWDVAAGVLLVQEAGGVVTDKHGKPFTLKAPHPVATAGPALHAEFCRLLAAAETAGGDVEPATSPGKNWGN